MKEITMQINRQSIKDNLEQLLMEDEKINSTSEFSDCHKIYGHLSFWKMIPASELNRIHKKCVKSLAEREQLERFNGRHLALRQCFEELELTQETTWFDAQNILWKSPNFLDNELFINMDDSEIHSVFVEFIEELERITDELESTQMSNKELLDMIDEVTKMFANISINI